MTERELVTQIARYMQLQYPRVTYRFDLAADLKLTSGQASRHKAIHPHRGYPDMFIAVCRVMPDGRLVGGLYLELKREGTRLRTKNGRWATQHIEEQATVLENLAECGYIAQFACGFDEAKQFIDSYLVPAWEPPLEFMKTVRHHAKHRLGSEDSETF